MAAQSRAQLLIKERNHNTAPSGYLGLQRGIKMIDTVDKETRSRMMSGIRSKDTKPELAVRRFLHSQGFRFRLHRKDLPGTPDLVLPKFRTVIFVHGCFWHGHACRYFRLPKSRTEFWLKKITDNQTRDATTQKALREAGWRIIVIHECEIRDHTGWEMGLLEAFSPIRTCSCGTRRDPLTGRSRRSSSGNL